MTLFVAKPNIYIYIYIYIYLFFYLQTPCSRGCSTNSIDFSLSDPFSPNLVVYMTRLLKLNLCHLCILRGVPLHGTWSFERMLASHRISHVTCHMSHVVCPVSHVMRSMSNNTCHLLCIHSIVNWKPAYLGALPLEVLKYQIHMGQTRQEVKRPKKWVFSRLQLNLQTWYFLFWGSKWFLPNKYAEFW